MSDKSPSHSSTFQIDWHQDVGFLAEMMTGCCSLPYSSVLIAGYSFRQWA
jgi:hypothetical protein